MKNLFSIFLVLTSTLVHAELPVDSFKCVTLDEAFQIEDELFKAGQSSNWVYGTLLEGKLEECIANGSIPAKYILGKWASIQSAVSRMHGKELQQSNSSAASMFYKVSQQSASKAIELLESAANTGYALAYFRLGEIYKEGIIVDRSKIISGKYFVSAGLAAFKYGQISLGTKSYEYAVELTPDHPDIPELKKLVYQQSH